MKLKITLVLALVLASAFSLRANAQSISFTDNGSATYVSGYNSDYDVAILDTLKSTYSANKQVTWSVVKLSGPSQWSFTNCDPASCYSAQSPYNYLSNSNTNTPWAIAPNASGTFTFHVVLRNIAGNGVYKLTAWVDGDSVNTAVSRMLNITVTQAVGISKISAPEVKLYPIPANDILNVDLNNFNDAKRVEVYNLIGAKMGSYPVDGDSNNSIPVNNLNPGMYFVKVMDSRSGILTTKTFQKR
ncbi:MAG: T9SS type A sorting domain-containing protein [Chitinophagales bacterium]|jgi:hypothetical protein|nr:T9SS type A sorting domain-containing protein [Chitinophagales bacterium]